MYAFILVTNIQAVILGFILRLWVRAESDIRFFNLGTKMATSSPPLSAIAGLIEERTHAIVSRSANRVAEPPQQLVRLGLSLLSVQGYDQSLEMSSSSSSFLLLLSQLSNRMLWSM